MVVESEPPSLLQAVKTANAMLVNAAGILEE
jgi:hypothetical protein